MSASLPSPTFLILTDSALGRGKGAGDLSLKPVLAAVRSGLWPLDPEEVDPTNGWNLLHTAVRHADRFMDHHWQALIVLAKDLGADLNALGPDGKTAVQWAHANKKWEVASYLEKMGATLGPNELSADLRELHQSLSQWLSNSHYLGSARFVESALKATRSGSLDERTPNQVPLGLLPVWHKLMVNGVALGPTGNMSPTDALRKHDEVFKSMRDLGLEALKQDPRSRFSLWCWAAMAQGQKWIHAAASSNRKNTYLAQWKSLEKALVRHYQKSGSPYQSMVQDFSTEVLTTVTDVWSHQQKKRDASAISLACHGKEMARVTALCTFSVAALAACANRLEGESPDLAIDVRQGAWQLLADLTRALPESFFEPEVAKGWRSGMYYALRDSIQEALRNQQPLPEFVVSPWLTLPPVLVTEDQGPKLDVATQWLMPQSPGEDLEKARLLLEPVPALRAHLEARRLALRLEDDPSPALRRGPRL